MSKADVDNIYIKQEDYIENPKDQFKRILRWIEQEIDVEKEHTLIDLGCAQGELIHFLRSRLDNVSFTGIDSSEGLINLAKENHKEAADFYVADIEEYTTHKKYDFLVICGVIEYLDCPAKIIKNINSMLKDDGRAIIVNIFNEYDIDVRVRYRNNKYFNDFRKGWSLHSLDTFKKVLDDGGLKICKLEKFFPDCFIEPKEDPARSWMFRMPNGKFKYRNGLSQLYDAYVIEVKKCMQ